jgi:hypothetical protein
LAIRTLATRVAALLILAGVVLSAAVVALGSQPSRFITHSGAIPDVPCTAGQSPEMSPFCLVIPPPNASKMPDTNVPPSENASTAP